MWKWEEKKKIVIFVCHYKWSSRWIDNNFRADKLLWVYVCVSVCLCGNDNDDTVKSMVAKWFGISELTKSVFTSLPKYRIDSLKWKIWKFFGGFRFLFFLKKFSLFFSFLPHLLSKWFLFDYDLNFISPFDDIERVPFPSKKTGCLFSISEF